MWVAEVFFGIILLTVLLAFREIGLYYGVRTEIANRLPGHSLIRRCILQPEIIVSGVLDRIAENPVRWSLRTFAVAYLVGGVTFSLLEPDASVFDGLWWAYISMLTVGYGDYSPKSWLIRSEAYIVIFLGWSSLLIMGAALSGRISERRIKRVNETVELHDDIGALCAELRDLEARFMAVGTELRQRELQHER